LVVFIADASNLKRNLLLFTQVCDLGVPVILAMNMQDIAAKRGISYDNEILSKELGVPVTSMNARNKEGIHELKKLLLNEAERKTTQFYSLNEVPTDFLEEISRVTDKKNHYAALQYAINAADLLSEKSKTIRDIISKYNFDVRAFQEKEVLSRYKIIDKAVKNARIKKEQTLKSSLSKKVDKVLTHRFYGIGIFLTLLFLIFQAIFSWSSYPMDWVEWAFAELSNYVKTSLPAGILNDLIVDGILAGLSGVIVFLPQIVILFLFCLYSWYFRC
jgi:ferrous iron transport protein B